MRILMVCLGNICRSPLAEGILRHKVKEHGLDWQVDSAGTSGYHIGEPADMRTIAVAKAHGLDITDLVGRKFSPYDFEQFDHIYVMDRYNLDDVLALAQTPEEIKKVSLIRNETQPGKNLEVPDPYYDDNGFEKVYQMLNEACDKIIERGTVS